jgi:hypothetical protein
MGVRSYLGLCDDRKTSHQKQTPPQHGGDTCRHKDTQILSLSLITLFHWHQVTIQTVSSSILRKGAKVKYLKVEQWSEKAEINFNHF